MDSDRTVAAALKGELDYLRDKLGGAVPGDGHVGAERSLDEFAYYILAYARQLEDLGTTRDADAKLDAVRKISGLSIACLEQHGALPRA